MKTTLQEGLGRINFMVNSGAWTGSRIKGLNSRIKGEHKVKEGNIGINNAGLID